MAQLPFKISARTAGLIGKENIATADGAIIELAKNSYDADASTCLIFFDFRDTKNRSLYIIDNGEGMTDEVIKEYWMTIGTSNKLHSPYTKNKRIKSGAKGIGRFALDRLGKKVEMLTKPKRSNGGFIWKANWEEFNDKKTLDNVFADLEIIENLSLEKEIKNIVGNFRPINKSINYQSFVCGTIIKISGLHDEWNKEDLENLFKNLEELIPPQPKYDFVLGLYTTSYEQRFGKIQSLFWDDYDYKLQANIEHNGAVEIKIDRREFNWKSINPDVFKERKPKDMSKAPYDLATLKKGDFILRTSIEEIWPGIKDQLTKEVIDSIGAFSFNFYFLKRSVKETDSKTYSYRAFDSSKRREWLDRFGGVKIFRDDFRVRPYGEFNSTTWDWLDLGSRASASTFGSGQPEGLGWRVGPNQIYGYVTISRLDNPELKDTTNREGLVDNRTFRAFKELLLLLINLIEKDRHYISSPMKVVYDREYDIALAKEEAEKQAEEDLKKQSKKKSKSKASKRKTTYAKATKGFIDEIEQKEDEIRMLRVLASLGMTISTFTHELKDIGYFLDSYSRKLKVLIESEINKQKFIEEKKVAKNPFLLLENINGLIVRLNNWIDFAINSIKKDRRKATDLCEKYCYHDEPQHIFRICKR